VPAEAHGGLDQPVRPIVAEDTSYLPLERTEVVAPGTGVLTDGVKQTFEG